MRKVIPYFLTLLLAFHTVGLGILYLVELHCCEMEFEDEYNLEEEGLLVGFVAGEKNFTLVNNHEILHEGKLFDILKKENRNGKLVYLAVNDKKEDRCMEGISRIAKGHSSESSLPGKSPVVKFLKYTCQQKNKNFPGGFPLLNLFPKGNFSHGHYLSPDRDIFSPPPNRMVS